MFLTSYSQFFFFIFRYIANFINFSAQTTSNQTQDMILSKLDRSATFYLGLKLGVIVDKWKWNALELVLMEYNCIYSLSILGSCVGVFSCGPLRKFRNKIAENCSMKVPTRSGIKLKIGAVVTVCKAAQTRYPCEGSACFGATASLQRNRPFASSHSHGTELPYRRARDALGETCVIKIKISTQRSYWMLIWELQNRCCSRVLTDVSAMLPSSGYKTRSMNTVKKFVKLAHVRDCILARVPHVTAHAGARVREKWVIHVKLKSWLRPRGQTVPYLKINLISCFLRYSWLARSEDKPRNNHVNDVSSSLFLS